MNLRLLKIQKPVIRHVETGIKMIRKDCSPKKDHRIFRIRCGLSVHMTYDELLQFGCHDSSKVHSWYDVKSDTELNLVYMSENSALEMRTGAHIYCYLFRDVLVDKYFMCYKRDLLGSYPELFKDGKLIMSS